MSLRDPEVDKLIREGIPDILRRLDELEDGLARKAVVIVEEKDGIYEYGVLPNEPASSSVP